MQKIFAEASTELKLNAQASSKLLCLDSSATWDNT